MAILLAEAAKLSTDILLAGIIETIVKDSPVLQRLPFIEVVGNGLTYNRELTLPVVAWYNENEAWGAETAPTLKKVTAGLEILGANADVDNFIKATRSNIQDVEAAVIELNAKSIRHEFEKTFIDGLGTAGAKDFAGLDALAPVHDDWAADTAYVLEDYVIATTFNGWRYEATVAGSSHATTEPTWPTTEGSTVVDEGVTWTCRRCPSIEAGTNGATLTLAFLDELIDKVLGGKPDLLLMSRRSRRKVNLLSRASGVNLQTERDEFGNFIDLYNGIPVGVSDWILDNVTQGSSDVTSSIYAFQMGEGALCGLSSPGLIQV
ncbi:unnamed protein product, partial [marine sediment metagenome]